MLRVLYNDCMMDSMILTDMLKPIRGSVVMMKCSTTLIINSLLCKGAFKEVFVVNV